MNTFEQYLFDRLLEGKSTGDSPTQTGKRVRKAVEKLKVQGKFTSQKEQQVADIGSRTSSRQGRRKAEYWSNQARRSDIEGAKDSEEKKGEYSHKSNTRRAERDRTEATITARRRYDAAREGGGDDRVSRIKASRGKPRFGKDAFPT